MDIMSHRPSSRNSKTVRKDQEVRGSDWGENRLEESSPQMINSEIIWLPRKLVEPEFFKLFVLLFAPPNNITQACDKIPRPLKKGAPCF